MKGSWNWKKFLALFMAIAMVMASGIFVTTQSFQATDDESYEQGETEDSTLMDITSEEAAEETQEITADEQTTEETEETEEETVETAYQLTVHFVDADGNKITDDYEAEYEAGESYHVDAPDVAGYTADVDFIESDEAGMPAEDTEQEITYTLVDADAVEAFTEEAADEAETAEADEATSDETAAEDVEATESETTVAETDDGVVDDTVVMPAMTFAEATASGIRVNASVDKDVFPAGTTMVVADVDDATALAAAQQAVSDATEAIAVEISFFDAEGNEIQPKGKVSVSFATSEVLTGDSYTVVHVEDDGSAHKVGGAQASANSASFSSNSFSTYVLTGNGETYAVEHENRTFNYTIEAYEALTLIENAANGKNEYLGGTWAITKGDDIISFAKNANTTPSTSAEQKTIAIRTSGESGDAVVTYTYKDGKKEYVDTINIHVNGYTAHFNLNGGSGSVEDVTVTMSLSLTSGLGSAMVQMPSAEGLSRDGYTLIGWSLRQDAMTANRRFGWYDPIYDLDDGNAATTNDTYVWSAGSGEELTFYAMWAQNKGASGSVGFFVRNDGTIQTEPAQYNSANYTTITQGCTNGEYYMNVSDLTEWITLVHTETDVNQVAVNLTAKAYAAIDSWNELHKQKLGTYFWDPETQYVQWYVIKCQGNWHVDGVIRSLSSTTNKVSLDYNTNCSDYTGQAPVGMQYDKGTEITIPGANTLQRTGYTFGGWNTKADGSGFGYQEGDTLILNEDTVLYAQWLPNSDTIYTLKCYDTETGEEISNTRKVRRGVTGNMIEAIDSDKILPGYDFDEDNENNVLEAAIAADGSTTLVLWFDPGHAIDITLNTVRKVYDKEAVAAGIASVTVDGKEVDYKLNGDNLTVTYEGKDYTVSGMTLKLTDIATGETLSEAVNVGTYTTTLAGNVSDCAVTNSKGKTAKAFTVDVANGVISISKRSVTLTSADGEWEYDGKAHTAEEVTVTGDGWLSGDEPTYKFTGSQKAPGESDNTFGNIKEGTWTELYPNYDVEVVYGTLKVTSRDATKYQINIYATNVNTTYDGKKHSADKNGFTLEGAGISEASRSFIEKVGDFFTRTYTVYFTMDGETYSITGLKAEGEGTDAGAYEILVRGGETIKDDGGNDVTDQFTINKINGQLTIDKATVTLRSVSKTKVYDGAALTNDGADLEEETGWADGEGASYTFSGSQTAVGTSDNTFTYELKSNTNPDNYTINQYAGSLTVTSSGAAYEVTITTNEATYPYTGEQRQVKGFENETDDHVIPVVASNGRTYYVSNLTAEATGTDAGTYPVSVSGDILITDADNNDVTSEFKVTVIKRNLVINKRSIQLVSADVEKEYDGDALTNPDNELVTTGTDVITVTSQGYVGGDGFAANDSATYTFTGKQTVVGSSRNTFTYQINGNPANYDVTTSYGTLTVKNREAKYEVTITGNSESYVYDGTEHEASGFINDGEKGIPVVASNGKTYYVDVTDLTTQVKGTDVGTYKTETTGSAKVVDENGEDVTNDFNINIIPGTLTITKRTVTIQSASLTKVYDGSALVNGTTALSESGWASGEGATYTFSGSQTLAGTSPNAFTYVLNDNTKESNYNINKIEGTLTVTDRGDDDKLTIKVQANSATYDYNGLSQSVSGFENQGTNGIEVTVGGHTYYVTGLTSTATAKDVTKMATSVTGTATVTDAAGNDVTKQFDVIATAGTLEIRKIDLTLVSADLSKEFDGTALVNGDTPIEATGWANTDGASYIFTGTQTYVGNSPNAFEVIPNDGTSLDNYNVIKQVGTLTVTNRDALYEVTITGNSANYTYDGQMHTVEGFNDLKNNEPIPVEADGRTYYVTGVTSTKSAKNVVDSGRTSINGTPVVTDENGEDVTDQFTVHVIPGELTIGKRSITLTSEDRSKVYDGYPLTNGDGKITISGDGLLDSEQLVFTFTGSQTLVGSSANSFTYDFATPTATAGADDTAGLGMGVVFAAESTQSVGDWSNYEITVVYGTLTVTTVKDENTTEDNSKDEVDDKDVVVKTHETGVYAIGQTVDFTITVTNIYADARTITITEQEGVTLDANVFENVAGGAEVTTTAHYVITEADALAGGFTNNVNVNFSDGETPGGDYTGTDDVTTEEPNGSLAIHKSSDVETNAKIGDTVTYTIEVINNGNVAVSDITVADELTGESWTLDSLATGASETFTTTYVVTEADVANGGIHNVATASGTDGNGTEVTTEGTDDSDVEQLFKVTVHFVDEDGNPVAGDFTDEYQYQTHFHIDVPDVSGYTPEYSYIESDENGMPAQDVEITVTYYKNKTVVDNNGGTVPNSDDDDDNDDVIDTTNDTDNSGGSTTGVGNDGVVTTASVRTPAVNNNTMAAAGIVAPGAVVSIGEDGYPELIQADDAETPLAALGLGLEKCDVIPFICLVLALIMVGAHANMMKKKQKRIFELRTQLDEMTRE